MLRIFFVDNNLPHFQAAVSNKRLSKFLSEEELQPGVIGVADPKVVKLEEASLNWQGAKFDPTLKDVC